MPKLYKAADLAKKNTEDLEKNLDELKGELLSLRVAQVTTANPNKLTKLRIVRRQIAQVLTELTSRAYTQAREENHGKKYQPIDLRLKKTRAARRALTKKELSNVSRRTLKVQQNFPQKCYSLKA